MRERHSFVLCDIAVVDGTGGPVREHAFLDVLGSRIARIGDMADSAPHDAVEEIRLPGHYVMPGLIDAHVHLSGGRAEVDDQEIGVVAEPMGLKAMRSVYAVSYTHLDVYKRQADSPLVFSAIARSSLRPIRVSVRVSTTTI